MQIPLISFLLSHLVLALMLSVGLSARPRDLLHLWHAPRLYLRALVVIELGVPLLAMAVVGLFSLPPVPAGVVLVMAVSPGAPFIPRAAKTKDETHSQVGLNLLLLVSLLAPVSVPTWIGYLDRIYPFHLAVSVVEVVQRVVWRVFAPLLCGISIAMLLPRVAIVLGRVVKVFFSASFLLAIAAVLYLGAPVLLKVSLRTLLAVLVMVAGSGLMGGLAGAPVRRNQRTFAIAAVSGNPGIALTIIELSHPGLRAPTLLAAYLVLQRLAFVPFQRWVRRRQSDEG
jgi:BASS family bile acid:Na+ symporter